MNAKELKKQLQKVIKRVGPKKVCVALQGHGLSPRQAEMLTTGDHGDRGFRRKTVAAVLAVLTDEGLSAKAS